MSQAVRKYSATPLYEAEVMFDYEAVEPTELTVSQGQIVAVREINDSGWCLVKIGDGRSGWVPLDYLEKLDDKPPVISSLPVVPEAVETPAEVPLPPPPAPSAQDDADATAALQKLNLALGAAGGAGGAGAPAKPLESCAKCKTDITSKYVMAKDKLYHTECFSCTVCSKSLAGQPFIEKDAQFFCEDDYYRKFNPPCAGCNDVIKGRYITALGQAWHPEHFVCAECNQPFKGDQFRKHDDKPYCDEHFNKLFGTTCSKCSKSIDGQVFEALGKKFHLDCFTCEIGNHPIGEANSFHLYEEKVYCTQHFDDIFIQKCVRCTKPIMAEYIKVLDNHYHPECWRCATCDTVITRSTCEQFAQKFVCQSCYATAVQSSKGATREAPKAPAAPTAAPQATGAATAAPAVKAPTETKVDVSAGTAGFGKSVSSAAARIIQQAAELKNPPARPSAGSVSKRLPQQETDFVSYALLKTNKGAPAAALPEWVDTTKKEQYLEPAVFEKLFKMTKEEFGKQKAWKQQKMKEELGLW